MVVFSIVMLVFRGVHFPIICLSSCQASNSSSERARFPGIINLTVAPFFIISISTPFLTEYNDDPKILYVMPLKIKIVCFLIEARKKSNLQHRKSPEFPCRVCICISMSFLHPWKMQLLSATTFRLQAFQYSLKPHPRKLPWLAAKSPCFSRRYIFKWLFFPLSC